MKAIANRLTQMARMAALAFAVLAVGNAWAAEITGYEDFGDVAGVQLWRTAATGSGVTDFAFAKFAAVAADGTVGETYTQNTSTAHWRRWASKFQGGDNSYYTAPGLVLVYDQADLMATPSNGATFAPVSFGGLWVKELGANDTPYGLTDEANKGRQTEFGATGYATLFKFEKSFTINRGNASTFYGTATVNITGDAVFTASTGYATVVDADATLKLTGDSTAAMSVGTGLTVNGTLDLTASTLPTISGNVTLSNGSSLVLPAGIATGEAISVAVCSGTLSASGVISVKIGSADAINAELTVSGGAITQIDEVVVAKTFASDYPSVVPAGYIYTFTTSAATTLPSVTVNGTLKTEGDFTITDLTVAAAGALEVVSGNTTVGGSADCQIKGNVTVDAGATLTNTRTDSLDYNGSMTVDVFGTLAMGSTRWSIPSDCTFKLHGGAQVTGVGDSLAVLDIIKASGSGLDVYAANGGGTVTIEGQVRVRANETRIWVAGNTTLILSRGVVQNGGHTGSFKQTGPGTLQLDAAMTLTGTSIMTQGTLRLNNTTQAFPLALQGPNSSLEIVATSAETTVPVNVTSIANNNVALTGSGKANGTITKDAAPSGNLATFLQSSAWEGTFVADWAGAKDTRFDINSYGNANSTVRVTKLVGGYATDGNVNNFTVIPTVEVSGFMTLDNGYSGKITTLTKLTGSGVFTNKTYSVDVTTLDNFTGTLATLIDTQYVGMKIGTINLSATPAAGAKIVNITSDSNIGNIGNTKVSVNGVVDDTIALEVKSDGIYVMNRVTVPAVEHATVSVAVNGNVVGSKAGDYYVTNGAEVIITYTADEGYLFGNDTSKVVDLGTVTAHREVTAQDTGSTAAAGAKIGASNYKPTFAAAVTDASDGDTVTLLAASNDNVTLSDKTIVFVENGFAFGGTLSGNGTIKVSAAPSSTTWSASRFSTVENDKWTGTFVIDWNTTTTYSNGRPTTTLNFNQYGISGSTVQLDKDWECYFPANSGRNTTIDPKIVLNATLKHGNGSTDKDYKWTPVIKFMSVSSTEGGVLDLNFQPGDGTAYANYEIVSLEDFKGKIKLSAARDRLVIDAVVTTGMPEANTAIVPIEITGSYCDVFNALNSNAIATVNPISVTANVERENTIIPYDAKAVYTTINNVSGLYCTVANIGDKYYATYAAAVADYTAGDTIVVSDATAGNVPAGWEITGEGTRLTKIQVPITWDVDGVQSVTYVDYGETPSYTGETPTRTATAQYTYAFTGWTPAFGAVTEATTYTAQFSSTVNQYTLTVPEVANATATVTVGEVEQSGVAGEGETVYTFDYGTAVTVTYTPDTYYSITAGDAEQVITITANTSAVAPTVTRNTVTVTVPTVDNASVNVAYTAGGASQTGTTADTYTVDQGTAVIVTYTAGEGYFFGTSKTKVVEIASVEGDTAVPAEQAGLTTAAVAQDSDGTYYADVMTGLYWLLTPANLESGYLQLLGDTTGSNVYGDFGIGYDATNKRYGKAVATIATEVISQTAGYLTVQEALDAATSGATVTLKADNEEVLTLANGKTITINAKQGQMVYTYTAPEAADNTYTVVAGETEGNATPYTARDWYTWTLSLGTHLNATVIGLPAEVSEGAADKTVGFTVTADDTYKVTAVKVGDTAIEGENGSYSYEVTGDATVTVETELDVATVTFYNEDGTAKLQSGDVTIGQVPTAPEAPEKATTAQYTYTFAGWATEQGGAALAELPAVAAGGATYYAVYTATLNNYVVSVPAVANATIESVKVNGSAAEAVTGGYSVPYGATVIVTYAPAAGYHLASGALEVTYTNVTGAGELSGQTLPSTALTIAKIGDNCYASLAAAVDAAQDGETVTMLADVTLTAPMDVQLGGKAVTLDLGGRTLTGRTNLKSGSLTIQNGTVVGGAQQALNVYGSATPAENYSVLTIAGNVTVTADVYGVCLFGPTYSAKSGYGAVINLAGTVTTTGDGRNGAVFVSGNLGNNVAGDANNIINVTGSITSATDAAIALNGLATVNVAESAVVVGDTAIAVKRGTLNVTGGTVHATGAKNYDVAAYGNGTEMTGAAISITDTYNKYGPMSVAVSGGVITSDNADALFKKEGAYTNDATMTVTDGEFSSAVPLEYCAEGFIPADNGSGSYGVTHGWVITFVVEGVETKVPTAAGATPAYTGTPAKAEDDEYTYTFAGWTPAIVAATEAVTYTATFTPVPKDVYDVTLTLNSAAIKVGNTTTLTVNISKNGTALNEVAQYSAEKTKWSLVVEDGECASVTKGPIAYPNRIIYTLKGLKAGATTLTYQNVDNPSLRFTVGLTVNHNLEVSYDSSYSAQKGALVENGRVAFTSIKLDGVEVEDRDAYTFTSENESVATVDKNGVTPVGVGSTYVNISLTSDPTITLRKAIKVVAAAAKIGDDYYATIADAFTAATDGQTIVLLKDVTESANYSTSDIEVTLDLNGFTWTGASNIEYTLRVQKGVVTVTDNSSGHTGAVTYGKDYAFIVDHVAADGVRSQLILNSGTFTGKTSVVQAGTRGGSGANTKYYGGDLVVNGGTFVTVDDTNDEHDTNGHFKYTLNKLDVGSVTVFTPSTITVNGGTFQNFDPANNVAEGTGTNFVPAGYVSLANTPSEGWYTVTGLVTFAVTAPAHTVVTVPGATNNGDGTFTVAPGTVVTIVYTAEEGYVFADNTTVKNVSYTANGGEVAEAEAAVAAVAKINTTLYSSLEAALAAAESGNTVTLLADVVPSATTVINGSVTLDLGGKTITGRVTVNTGTVTVQNGTVNGRFDAYDDSVVTLAATATVNGMVVVWGDGTFGQAGCKTPTLNVYGTITNSGEQAISTNGTDTSNPVINIYDGAVVLCEADDVGVFLPSGNLTVYGGTVTGATAVYVKSGSITVTGGTLTGIGSEHEYEYKGDGCTATGDAIVIDNAAYPNGTPVVAISGGKFVSNNASAIGVYAKEGETVVKHFVSGGQFSSQLTADLCATGFFPTTVTDSEGFYGVEAGSSVAYRGDDFYETLDAALEDAVDGDTITLLANVAVERTIIEKSVTLDLGGKTITGRVTVNTGTVTVQNGTIAGRFDAYDDSVVTLAATATVTGQVVVWGDGTFGAAGCKTPTLNVYGTVTYSGDAAITCNGTDKSQSVINVYAGATVTSDDIAIYMPSGKLTVSGGTITGATAIYSKSGSVAITGGTLTGNGTAADYQYNGNGAYATGDALVVESCSYPNGAPTALVTGGTLVSVNAKAIGCYATTGNSVPKNIVPAKVGSVENAARFKPSASMGIAAGYQLVADGETGFFKLGRIPAPENTVDVVSVADTTIVAIPADCTAAQLINRTNRAVGDVLKAYVKAEKRYYTWKLISTESEADVAWEPVQTWVIGGESATATNTKAATEVLLKKGEAVWVTRVNSSEPVYVNGTYAEEVTSSTVQVETGYNLVAPVPTEEQAEAAEIVINEVVEKTETTVADNDKIIVPPTETSAPVQLDCKVDEVTGKPEWGYFHIETYTDEATGKTRTRRVRKTDVKIPAGTGFWYISGRNKDISL